MSPTITEVREAAKDSEYSELLEDTEWGPGPHHPFISLGYSDLLEDTDW